MRKVSAQDVLVLLALGVVSFGAGMIFLPAGVIVAGLGLLGFVMLTIRA